jgi:hypothetical protein
VILILTAILLTFVLFLCGLGIGLIAYISIALGSLVVPVFVLERTGIGLGLRRSWNLAKRRFWMLFGIVALTTIVSFLSGLFVGLVAQNSLPLNIIFQSLVNIALVPLVPIANTLVYYDARVRYEDLEGALNSIEKPDARPADIDSPSYSGSFMEGGDFTNLAIMTALLFVVIILLGIVSIATSRAAIGAGQF